MISCLAMIIGASNDSGHGPSLHAWAKFAVLSPGQERFVGQCREGLRDSRSGLIMGDFESCLLLPTGLGVAVHHHSLDLFFPTIVSVRAGLWVCFRGTGGLSVCLAFFDPRGFPSDQRERWRV